MLTLVSKYLGVALDDGYQCAVLSYTRNRIDVYYDEPRSARGGVHITMRVFDHDKECDPTPPRRCEDFVFYYTYTGELTLRYPRGTGRRKQAGERVVPILITYDEAQDTHYVSPACGTWGFPCRDPIRDRVDIVDVVMQLDKVQNLALEVQGDIGDTIIDGLLTNSEKFGEFIRRKELRKNETCSEAISFIQPTEWGCIDGDCSGRKGPNYPAGFITERCDTEPCPPGFLLSSLDCSCVDRPCPPCPPGHLQIGAYPNCKCKPPEEEPCLPGFQRIGDECLEDPPVKGEDGTCYDCTIRVTVNGMLVKTYLPGDGTCQWVPSYEVVDQIDPNTGQPMQIVQEGVQEFGVTVCGQYSMRFEDDYIRPQSRPGPCDQDPFTEQFAVIESTGGGGGRFVFDIGDAANALTGDRGFTANRIVEWDMLCYDRNDPNKPPIRTRYTPRKPWIIPEPNPEPSTTCVFKVSFTVNLAIVAVRRNQAPGVPNSWYEGINFASLPSVGIELGPFDLFNFNAPCWLDQPSLRNYFNLAVTAANEYVDTAFDSLMVAAFGPPGLLLGRLIDIAITPNIERISST